MRWLFPLVLLLLALVRVPPAAGPLSTVEATVYRSEGARLRARIDRIGRLVEEGHKAEAYAAAELELIELRAMRNAAKDAEAAGPEARPPLPANLDLATIDAVSREVLTLRNSLLLAERPLADTAKGRFLSALVDAATWGDWAEDVPASITLAQAVLESNWGKSAPGNNYFGMKGTGTAGSVSRKVVEYRRGKRSKPVHSFRTYYTPDEAIADHTRLLSQSRRYHKARAVAEDPDAYARALQGVYASDPRYAQKLSDLMRRADLLRFNVPGAAPYR